jgi:hypothetical protein
MKALLLSTMILSALSAQQTGVTFDSGSSLLWQDNATVKKEIFTFAEAKKHCENLVIGEYSDFRLPTIYELQTIVDYKNHNPAILNGFKYTTSDDVWSSTPYAYRSDSYWTIDFKKGTNEPTSERYSKHIRCVQRIQ